MNLKRGEPPSARIGEVNCILDTPMPWAVVNGVHEGLICNLVILDTIYGMILCGSSTAVGRNVIANAIAAEDLNKRFNKPWQIEFFPRDNSESKLSMDKIATDKAMGKNLGVNPTTGRFETRLLWKGKPDLKNNYAVAKARLDGKLNRLRKFPETQAAYDAVIQDYLERSTLGEVTGETLAQLMDPSKTDWLCLPHRTVYDPKGGSTKCRIVMDASARTGSGNPLNDCLTSNPPPQLQIATVGTEYRTRKVALTGNCKKMFLQVKVEPNDNPFLHFLWHDPDDVHATSKIDRLEAGDFDATGCLSRQFYVTEDLYPIGDNEGASHPWKRGHVMLLKVPHMLMMSPLGVTK